MADLQRLVVSLEARLDKFDKTMNKAASKTDQTMGRIEKRFKKAEGVLSGFGSGIGASLLAGLSAGAITNFVRSAVRDLADLADNAKRAGVNVEDLQAAIFAARQEGGNAESLVTAFSKLNLELGQAASSGNELGKILKANGKELKDLQGDPVKALLIIADLMENAANEQDRAVIGNAAFGRGFREILPFLMQGSEEIKKMMDRGRSLGAVIGEETVAQAKIFDDKLTEITDVTLAQMKSITVKILEDFIGMVNAADELSSRLGGGSVGQAFMRMLRTNPLTASTMFLLDQYSDQPAVPGYPQVNREGKGSRRRGKPTVITVEASAEEKAIAAEAKRRADAILKVVESLQFERDQLNRTDRERAIYNELARAGVTLDSQHGRVIADLAGKFYDEKQALEDFTDSMDEARDITRGFFGDLISGLREGKSLTDALASAFQNLADKMLDRSLDMAMDALFGKAGTTSTGAIGQILGISAPAGGIQLPASIGRNPYDTMRGMGSRPISGNPLLDLIAKAEGTAKTGYNTTLDYGKWTGGPQDLTSMSLDQIAALQKKMLTPENQALYPGGGSSALGRYQITSRTLMDLREKLGLSGKELFDPAMQDKLALSLAQSRGPSVPGLQSEWAGLSKIPAPEILTNYASQFANSVKDVANTASGAASSFVGSFVPALQNILQAVMGGGVGSGLGGGIFGTLFQNPFGGGGPMAAGGPVSPFKSYMVGEKGPELFMPKVPGMIIPNGNLRGGGALAVRVTPSKYFDVHVERIASVGDSRTLNTARRNMPNAAAQFQKLGTTGN